MSKQLRIDFPTMPAILSISIPHNYQYEHHPQVLK